MKIHDENNLQLYFMFGEGGMKSEGLKSFYSEMDSVDNLNNNPMAVRIAGIKASRVAFMAGFRLAESRFAKLADAFDAWYCDSAHMCELGDKIKSGKATHDEVHELELLTSLLNTSINLSSPLPVA